MTNTYPTERTRIIAWNVARLRGVRATVHHATAHLDQLTGRRGPRGRRDRRLRLGPPEDAGLRVDAGPRQEDCLEDSLDDY